MLAKLTLLAETEYPQTGGFAYPLKAETAYVLNGNRIKSFKAYETSDTELEYVFEPNSKHASTAILRVDGTVASLVSTIETAYTSAVPALTVAIDYDGEVLDSAETRYFNAADIILCDAYDTSTPYTAVYVDMGGTSVKKYSVSQTLDEIITAVTS